MNLDGRLGRLGQGDDCIYGGHVLEVCRLSIER